MKKLQSLRFFLPIVATAWFAVSWAQTQYGEIRGKIYDKTSGAPLEFANIVILQNGIQKGGATSDLEGNYIIKPVPPGTYDLHATYVGYKDVIIKGIVVYPGKVTFQNLALSAGIELQEVEVIEYEKPLIEADNNTTGGTLTSKEIRKAPTRSVNQLAGLAGGVISAEGGTPVIKGQRTSGTIYYVDGVKVRGLNAVPQSAIEQLSVITGGVPAQYGDALGGIISIITKGPSERFYGSMELISSQLTDPYGYNTFEGNISGPILKRNKGTDKEQTALGFFLAGTYTYVKDEDPSAIGVWKVKDDVLAQLKDDPIRPNPAGGGFVSAVSFVRKDQMELVKTNPNAHFISYNLSPKIEWQIRPGLNFVLGGQYGYQNDPNRFRSYSLFNYENYPRTIRNTYRGYARLSQRFLGTEDTGGLLRNVYYSVQADYTKQYNWRERPDLGTDIFKYGHLGTFERYQAPFYIFTADSVNGRYEQAWFLAAFIDTLITFTPSDYNPVLARYTEKYFEREIGKVTSFQQIRARGGLINGETPPIVYSLWTNVGTPYAWYVKFEEEQMRVTANASADIGNHAISFGVEYEERTQYSYSLRAASLWRLMEQLMNRHLAELDRDNPQPVYDDNGVFLDTVNYPRKKGPDQSTFDKNFRQFLIENGYKDVYGRPIGELSFVNVHRYSPDLFKLSYFSPDELLQNAMVFYSGYDYLGNKLKTKPSLNDFLEDPDKRWIAPYNPIYMAGYIQDKFVMKEKGLIFRIGVRVDRFDANQPVLKDPYVLYPTYTAGEVTTLNGQPVQHPANIGDDYVVYTDKSINPTRIVGYRKGDEWFDANGTKVADPGVLAIQTATGYVQPYLRATSPTEVRLTAESFKDYEPQINVQPRIAFSFPISEDATFFANYDVLAQRPRQGIDATIDEFYYLQQRATWTISNPALRPEKRVNYEIGFKQRLSKNSAFTLTAYYGEVRDMVQLTKINYAYPISYNTYGNLDFATIKGMTFTYDMRRTRTSPVQAQLSYTLQFAEGTGSNEVSAARLIDMGQPNLRVPFPLDYDRRHTFNLMLDYRYGMGPAYTGPVTKNGKKILQGTGVNFIVTAMSGAPYSKQKNVTQAVSIGVRQTEILDGTPNGARKPWQFNVDMRLDRDFPLSFGKKKEGEFRRGASLNAYVWVRNLFNTKNIVNVYRYTGRPDDDGWLSSFEGIRTTNAAYDPQAYYDQYSIKVNNPANYSSPRLVRLGLILNF